MGGLSENSRRFFLSHFLFIAYFNTLRFAILERQTHTKRENEHFFLETIGIVSTYVVEPNEFPTLSNINDNNSYFARI